MVGSSAAVPQLCTMSPVSAIPRDSASASTASSASRAPSAADSTLREQNLLDTLEGMRADLVFPVVGHDRVLGLLCLRDERLAEAYSNDEIMLLGQLAAWGIETLPVTSGADALSRLRTELGRGQTVDAVIFPRDLPDLRASEFAARVREAAAPGAIRTIMLTTVANLESTSDLLAAGVIDPSKVARCALQNAASVASLMLTTETLIAEKPKKETAAPMGGPGMGGMGDMM